MKRFERSVDVLAKAWLKGTLTSGICTKCAVGNLIAAALGYKIASSRWVDGEGNVQHNGWQSIFTTSKGVQRLEKKKNWDPGAVEQILSTGYSVEEMREVEFTFESTVYQNLRLDRQEAEFRGLMAVVDLLAKFDGINHESRENAKAQFERA